MSEPPNSCYSETSVTEEDDASISGRSEEVVSEESATKRTFSEEEHSPNSQQESEPPADYNRKWPSYLMQLTSNSDNGDEWLPVMKRIQTTPQEILVTGRHGQTALHAACIRYPPAHVVLTMIQKYPQVASRRNRVLETPLHLASFSATEEVQSILINAAPQTVSMQDRYGDTPLHLAARQRATLPLMEQLVRTAPEAISVRNEKGETPFWILPRSYTRIGSLEDLSVLIKMDESDDFDDDMMDPNIKDDWDLLVLFLSFSYFDRDRALQIFQERDSAVAIAFYDQWMVHAATATTACPRETLRFLCRIFPNAATGYHRGLTPLLIAATSAKLSQPTVQRQEEEVGGDNQQLQASDGSLDTDLATDAAMPDAPDDRRPRRRLSSSSRVPTPSSAVQILLEHCPRSASYVDADGRLPLARALMAGKDWESVACLIEVCPNALQTRDLVSGMYMFQLAAIAAPDLDTVYHVLRQLPGVVLR